MLRSHSKRNKNLSTDQLRVVTRAKQREIRTKFRDERLEKMRNCDVFSVFDWSQEEEDDLCPWRKTPSSVEEIVDEMNTLRLGNTSNSMDTDGDALDSGLRKRSSSFPYPIDLWSSLKGRVMTHLNSISYYLEYYRNAMSKNTMPEHDDVLYERMFIRNAMEFNLVHKEAIVAIHEANVIDYLIDVARSFGGEDLEVQSSVLSIMACLSSLAIPRKYKLKNEELDLILAYVKDIFELDLQNPLTLGMVVNLFSHIGNVLESNSWFAKHLEVVGFTDYLVKYSEFLWKALDIPLADTVGGMSTVYIALSPRKEIVLTVNGRKNLTWRLLMAYTWSIANYIPCERFNATHEEIQRIIFFLTESLRLDSYHTRRHIFTAMAPFTSPDNFYMSYCAQNKCLTYFMSAVIRAPRDPPIVSAFRIAANFTTYGENFAIYVAEKLGIVESMAWLSNYNADTQIECLKILNNVASYGPRSINAILCPDFPEFIKNSLAYGYSSIQLKASQFLSTFGELADPEHIKYLIESDIIEDAVHLINCKDPEQISNIVNFILKVVLTSRRANFYPLLEKRLKSCGFTDLVTNYLPSVQNKTLEKKITRLLDLIENTHEDLE